MAGSATAIYGAGGFAREIAPLVTGDDLVFVSDVPDERLGPIGGRSVISFEEPCSSGHAHRSVVIAIGSPQGRREVSERCRSFGLRVGAATAATHRRMERVRIAEGATLCDHSVFTSDVVIGRHFHLNLHAYVAHDCRIGDFAAFAPRVCCNGHVEIGDGTYLGTGAITREGKRSCPLRIGARAVVGMGSVVTRDVPSDTTVYGVPGVAMGHGDRLRES